jgi:hypothetical protein
MPLSVVSSQPKAVARASPQRPSQSLWQGPTDWLADPVGWVQRARRTGASGVVSTYLYAVAVPVARSREPEYKPTKRQDGKGGVLWLQTQPRHADSEHSAVEQLAETK